MSDVNLTISAENVFCMVQEIRSLEDEITDLKADIAIANKKYEDYKAAAADREANIRKQADKERENLAKDYRRRMELLELSERKAKAWNEYLGAKGFALNAIEAILRKRVTKKDDAKLKPHLDSINAAWEKFDEIQKQVADEIAKASWDPCKSKMPPSTV